MSKNYDVLQAISSSLWGGERANQDGSETPQPSHGEKVQASLVEVTGKVLEARPPRGVWQASVESL
jgi:hypothetical protein